MFDRVDDANDKATHFMGAVVTMPARSVPVGVSKSLIMDGQRSYLKKQPRGVFTVSGDLFHYGDWQRDLRQTRDVEVVVMARREIISAHLLWVTQRKDLYSPIIRCATT